jgi:ubiquitin C-terminal hydrolase
VHSGSADVGHYYSIVKKSDGCWLKLDDSRSSILGQNSFET